MNEIELFIVRIPNFKGKTAAQLIDYFAFFLQQICNQKIFSAIQIRQCFESLELAPYSNISSYLGRNAGKAGRYVKRENGYILERKFKEQIAEEVSEIVELPVSLDLIDISIVERTPFYVKSLAREMIHCYDSGFYNATLVLMRKLMETLIIECFERYGIDNEIKDPNGNFYYLSELIPHYFSSTKWNASRNITNSLTFVKKYGDLSAHNRRFLAKKSDLDGFKLDLRQALQEIILTIDYTNWEKKK